MVETLAVVGLGYVGFPLATALARAFGNVVGFDTDERRIRDLRMGLDVTLEVKTGDFESSRLNCTNDPLDLAGCSFVIVAVPTSIDLRKMPDLAHVRTACEIVGQNLSRNSVVVFESTLYPGVTEEICRPIIERESGLVQGRDFSLAYSPERVNPGDPSRQVENIIKIIAADTPATLERVAAVYEQIVTAGVYRAPSIRVAEAAKVLENTQRDLNIALMNELAMICDRLELRTVDVIEAASTKWNFVRFMPGLVGGHCIGVDPYYLTAKAQELGYHPNVILAGRQVNDGMAAFVARKLVRLLADRPLPLSACKVAVLGVTFKENVPDIRNSKAIDLIAELRDFGIRPFVHDPLVEDTEELRSVGIELCSWEDLNELDGCILAVPHRNYMDGNSYDLTRILRDAAVLIDVKSVLVPRDLPSSVVYWSL